MNAPRPAFVRCLARAVTPSLLLAVGAAAMFLLALRDVADVAEHARRVDAEIALGRARLAAETLLADAALVQAGSLRREIAGVQVVASREGGQYLVDCRIEGIGQWQFVCEDLPGGAPAALGFARAAVDARAIERLAGGQQLDPGAFPRPVRDLECATVSAVRLGLVRRDGGIALQHFDAGTDGDDFRWCAERLSPGGLGDRPVVVPGHLWFAPAARPLELELDRDLVVFVRGNLYLGRSLHVVGEGRLLIVTSVEEGSLVFADRDGTGGWTAGDELREGARFHGPVEGGGACWLGLPGTRGSVRCDAGLVVAGELQVAAPAEIVGPLVLRHGITDPGGHVAARGLGRAAWGYRPARERIPGFEVEGTPRPGLLRLRSPR